MFLDKDTKESLVPEWGGDGLRMILVSADLLKTDGCRIKSDTTETLELQDDNGV